MLVKIEAQKLKHGSWFLQARIFIFQARPCLQARFLGSDLPDERPEWASYAVSHAILSHRNKQLQSELKAIEQRRDSGDGLNQPTILVTSDYWLQ